MRHCSPVTVGLLVGAAACAGMQLAHAPVLAADEPALAKAASRSCHRVFSAQASMVSTLEHQGCVEPQQAAQGNQAAALRFARKYESRVQRELESPADPSIVELIASLRTAQEQSGPAAVSHATAEVRIQATDAIPKSPGARKRGWQLWLPASLLTAASVAAVAWGMRTSRANTDSAPFLAIGFISSRDTSAPGPVLRDMLGRRGGDLSGGQQQQLAIARALVMRPRLLVLDEPTEGIQPSIIKEIGRAIRHLKEKTGLTILLVEQYLDFARELADAVVVMDRGEVVFSGRAEDLERHDVRRSRDDSKRSRGRPR